MVIITTHGFVDITAGGTRYHTHQPEGIVWAQCRSCEAKVQINLNEKYVEYFYRDFLCKLIT